MAAAMLATGGAATGLTGLSTPAAAAPAAAAPVLTTFSTPLDNDHRWDRDHGRSWDGDRRGNDGWDGHPWRWWHDAGISPDLCRDGGGHVVGDHRCEGGRFDDFHVR
jgi:hypothetical protein